MTQTPRATSQIHDDGAFGPYFRLRCACCGCPTLEAGTLYLEETSWPQVCLLCDWENAIPDLRIDRDDSVPLTEAQANVNRYGWMYDPANPPEWLMAAPNDEELQMRQDLREVYAAIDEEPDGPRFFELWEIARGAEDDLTRIAQLRIQRAVSSHDDDLSDIDIADPGALGQPPTPDIGDENPDPSSNDR